jgi:hypothetical protein
MRRPPYRRSRFFEQAVLQRRLGQPANAQQPNQISTLADPLSDLINGIGPKRSLGPRHDFRRYCSIAVIA